MTYIPDCHSFSQPSKQTHELLYFFSFYIHFNVFRSLGIKSWAFFSFFLQKTSLWLKAGSNKTVSNMFTSGQLFRANLLVELFSRWQRFLWLLSSTENETTPSNKLIEVMAVSAHFVCLHASLSERRWTAPCLDAAHLLLLSPRDEETRWRELKWHQFFVLCAKNVQVCEKE